MKSGIKQWFSSLFEGSAICRALDRFGSFLYRKLGHGLYSFLFGSYDEICETFGDSAVGNATVKSKRGRVRAFIASDIEESVYVSAIASLMRYLSRLSMRVIGVFLMSCGFYSLVAQLIQYLMSYSEVNLVYGAISVAMILLGVPFMFSGKALCTAVYESTFWNAVFTGFCGFNERSFRIDGEPTGRKNAAFILGLPFGILTCFFNPLLVIAAMVGIIIAYIVLLHPECGLLAAIFMLPFLIVLPHPSILLGVMTLYVTFCFGVKILLGKRYFKLELLDIFVALFMLATMLGGIISYGGMQSLKSAAIYVVLMLGYFLAAGLLNSKQTLKKAVIALGSSMFLVSLYGIYQNLTGNISTEWIDTEMFDSIGGRVVSTFENPNMLGEYLILLLPIVAAVMIGDKKLMTKFSYIIAFATGCGCLVYTWARGAWLGFLLASAVFLLMWSRHTMGVLVAAICALPVVIPYLPAGIVSRFSSIGDLTDTSTNYRVYIWRGSAKLASDYALTGIGVGEDAFNRIYPYYSFAGIEKAPHAHNLFLQLFIELGIFGFIIFVAFLICCFQSGFSLAKHGDDKEVRLIGCGALCGILAALAQGMTDYVWYNYRVFFVFWLMVGIASAARRIDYEGRKRKKSSVSEHSADITI